MSKRKIYFGTDRIVVDRIYSLDEKWFVDIFIVKYYFFGIEIHAQKKEIVKYLHSKHAGFSRTV